MSHRGWQDVRFFSIDKHIKITPSSYVSIWSALVSNVFMDLRFFNLLDTPPGCCKYSTVLQASTDRQFLVRVFGCQETSSFDFVLVDVASCSRHNYTGTKNRVSAVFSVCGVSPLPIGLSLVTRLGWSWGTESLPNTACRPRTSFRSFHLMGRAHLSRGK